MKQWIGRYWFLFLLVILLTAGLVGGLNLSAEQRRSLTGWVSPAITTAIILFLMSVTLDTRQLWHASAVHPWPALLGFAVNFVAGPLLAGLLYRFQSPADFEIGFLIVGCVPCTLATAVVWTRRAQGNDAVALLITLVSNSLCFLITPAWIELFSGRSVPLSGAEMGWRLFNSALAPTIAGQVVRRAPMAAAAADRGRALLGAVAQALVLLIVFVAATDAGGKIAATGRWPRAADLFLVWSSCIALHLTLLTLAWQLGRAFRFRPEDAIAAAIAGSQKTLPIGLLLALDPSLFGHPDLLGPGKAAPFLLMPIILYHVSQLFLDALIVDRWRIRRSRKTAENAANRAS